MARSESDREDLLREATALIERAELRIAATEQQVVVGFRSHGAVSIFFGSDPVYQFNTSGELRRAFVSGRLLKAERGRLIALSRERAAAEVALLRSELTAAESAELLDDAASKLGLLSAALAAGHYETCGVVPQNSDVIHRIRAWLGALSRPIPVAHQPHVQ